jgi:LysR family transcriptional regulator, glycine cleavage system transcriptional activator
VFNELPPLELFRAFDACARHSSFTLAANELGITQGAVSLRVRDLEAYLGFKLFIRSRPRVQLTEAGLVFAPEVSKALEVLKASVRSVRIADRPIRISAVPIFARWLGPRLVDFGMQVNRRAVELEATADLRNMAAGEFELAVRGGVGPWPPLSSEVIVRNRRTPMVSPELARKLDLACGPAALLDAPLLDDDGWHEWFAAADVREIDAAMIGPRYTSQALLADAAISGAGAALLSPKLLCDAVRTGALLRPFPQEIESAQHYHLVWDSSVKDQGRDELAAWIKRRLAE